MADGCQPSLLPVSGPEPATLTQLIHRSRAGDSEATDALFAATYGDLRRLARARLRAGGRNTFLETGSLVHESYLRFAGAGQLDFEDRVHFMRWAGRVMRSVIVDIARRRKAERRGGGAAPVPLEVEPPAAAPGTDEILRVHQALDQVSLLDARMAEVVEMRYFGGLTEPEIALALGVTTRTVDPGVDAERAAATGSTDGQAAACARGCQTPARGAQRRAAFTAAGAGVDG
ncbi:MAG TPA: ECF-type sigma factor [Vicinamibacterales bacterium]